MLLFFPFLALAQQGQPTILRFEEYLGYVKKFHPVAKQAELQLSSAQANLMQSRGSFDPKLEVDYERKVFKGTEYYNRLNTAFKIPTWYGIEFKGGYQRNEGDFLDPSEVLPPEGLFSAGVTLSVGKGLWMSERMATLKQAKIFREQARYDRDLLVNDILYRASIAYFDWYRAFKEMEIFRDFLLNAQSRLQGINKSASAGDLAAIDTVEAKIAMQDRALRMEQARVNLNYKALEVSNFLWLDEEIPVELQPNVIPESDLETAIDQTLELSAFSLDSISLEGHPKIRSLSFKRNALEVDRNLKVNKILPKIDLEYNFLTETPGNINTYQEDQHKAGISISLPLFLRKERGALKLADLKIQYANNELDNAETVLRNKIVGVFRELGSYESQNELVSEMVDNYTALLSAEERKFGFGESSLFLINTRESKLIDAKLKQNEVENKYFTAKAKLFKSLALNPQVL